MAGPKTAHDSKPKRRRGRPQVHDEAWTKVSVVLFDRQIKKLDHLRHLGEGAGGRRLTRASLIRSLIDGVMASGVMVQSHASEAALRDSIAAFLQSARRRSALHSRIKGATKR